MVKSYSDLEAVHHTQPTPRGVFGLWSSIETVGRAAHAYSVMGTILASYRYTRSQDTILKKKLGISGDSDADEHPELLSLWEAAHEANARRMYDAIVKLRGLWIKVGQFLSSRVDIVPIPYIKKLANLQDSVPTHPWGEVEKTLHEDLGLSWRSEFECIDETPLCSASIAQVHCATLLGGQNVVLKVQHRGVEKSMKSDLDTLSAIASFIAWIEPDYDFRKIVDEWKPAVRQELDMRLEARALEEVSTNMTAAGVNVIVPKPYTRLNTKRVLLMEFCDGFAVRDMEAMDKNKVDRNLLMDRICQAFAVQMHVNGFFNADPHPGNILVSTNGVQNGNDPSVPVLLDFGLTKRFSPNMLVAFARMMHASYAMDVDELVVAFKEMELKLAVNDPLEDLANMRQVFQAVPREKSLEMRSQMKTDREAKMATHPNPKKPVECWPADLVFFFRVTGLLRGLAASLDVEYPYLKTMATAALETIKAQIPRAEWASGLIYGVQQGAQMLSPTTLLQLKLESAVHKIHEQTPILGMQIAAFHEGECVANLAVGTLGTADPRPVTHETLFNVFSVTKGITAAAALVLMQKGLLDLDAPVSTYWPQFATQGKQHCTARHILCHQAGLANALPESATLADLSDYHLMVDFVANAAPEHAPGEETHYHYLTFGWLVGGLIQAVAGSSLLQVIQERISAPLGIQDGIYIGIPADIPSSKLAILNNGFSEEMAAARLAHGKKVLASPLDENDGLGEQTVPAQGIMHSHSSVEILAAGSGDGSKEAVAHRDSTSQKQSPQGAVWERFKGKEHLLNPTTFNMRQIREAVIPAANGHVNAFALARFYANLSSSVDGIEPLFSSATVHQCLASCNETVHGEASEANPLLAQHTSAFGLGFQVHKLRDMQTGETVHSIGHSGVGGSLAFVIPERKVSFAITINNLTGMRMIPNLICSQVLSEFGLEAPPGMVGNVNHATLDTMLARSHGV